MLVVAAAFFTSNVMLSNFCVCMQIKDLLTAFERNICMVSFGRLFIEHSTTKRGGGVQKKRERRGRGLIIYSMFAKKAQNFLDNTCSLFQMS